MKKTLTKRWVEYKQDTQEKEIIIGEEIEYYGNGVQNPSLGIVKEKFGSMVIEWEDSEHDTPLDGSEQSEKILKDCGFYN